MGISSKLYNLSRLIGFEPLKLWKHIVYTPRFVGDVRRYSRQPLYEQHFPLRLGNLKPLLLDYSEQAGEASGHYFYQDIWAARKVFQARPKRHLDIGSRIDGFVAHVLSFMPIEIIDIRPLNSSLEGLTFIQSDATELRQFPDQSVESLSSLHAIEHFGLGRYSDPVDPQACFRAMSAMQRVLAPGGRLYFSVPVGVERVEFNAHRVFSPRTVLDQFRELKLVSFASVDDAGVFRQTAQPDNVANARVACGMFEFMRV